MQKLPVVTARILKVNSEELSEADDLLAAEEPLEIRLGYGEANDRSQKSISVTMRTPGNDFELALGFLFTEGIIKDVDDIFQIKYCSDSNRIEDKENIVRVELKEKIIPDLKKLERHFYTSSSCGVCGKSSIESVRREICQLPTSDCRLIQSSLILKLPDLLRNHQQVFKYTGGLHASALFNLDGELIFVREDVGRHNALDKLIGAALTKKMMPLSWHILLLSGRISFELVQKAAMAGIKMIAAVGAPSGLAVEMAKSFDITLIGFLRDKRFNIYSGEERIIIKEKVIYQ